MGSRLGEGSASCSGGAGGGAVLGEVDVVVAINSRCFSMSARQQNDGEELT